MYMPNNLNEMTLKSQKLQQTVLNFIARFTTNGKRREVIECFSCGCCYWFAEILFDRFCLDLEKCWIVYDPVINHWACRIGDRIYDITGDITDNKEYNWRYWNKFMYEDISLTKRLYRDCINFGEREDEWRY